MAVTCPGLVQHNPAFRQVEVERAARLPGAQQGTEGGVERRERQAQIVALVLRILHLLVGQPCCRAH